MTYNEDIPPNCQEPFLNLIKTQSELKEFELKHFSTTSFTPLLRHEMLQVKSQSLRKLILQGIKFDKYNLANLVPNLEVLSIKCSFGNPFGNPFEVDQNNLQNLQRLELVDNNIELNRIILKTKCKSLKFFIINERELSNEVKEEFIFLLCQNYPNITTLCYATDNLTFSSTLKKFYKLCQLQIGGFAYYNIPYSSQDYLQTLIRYLPSSLKILSLLNIYDYSYENLNYFLQALDIERVKLEVFILPFNVELDLLQNLRKFIEKAKYLRYIEIVRSDVEKQKDSEREIIDFCQVRNIKCGLKYQLERYKDYFCTYEINFESYIGTEE
ncbi:13389_t:CDS:1 [Cetraspora pellucida]|uniref:13389_t:CDS:1 n=1 Tax=Cetraspora pellucida TaxID=1433469 RepID=A0ACA9MCT5_9GLOM|nr:13389_t:CDS:1 [Cetraspora pellucida]